MNLNETSNDSIFIFQLVKNHLFDYFTGIMRITVDIDEATLEEVIKLTGEKKKGPAVTKAATEFVRRQLAREFGRRVMEGEFEDYPLTNAEIETVDR